MSRFRLIHDLDELKEFLCAGTDVWDLDDDPGLTEEEFDGHDTG